MPRLIDDIRAAGHLRALFDRWKIWSHALRWGWLVILGVWSVLNVAFTFRDNFLPDDLRAHLSTYTFIAGWDWRIWVMGCLSIALVAALEGCYRGHHHHLGLAREQADELLKGEAKKSERLGEEKKVVEAELAEARATIEGLRKGAYPLVTFGPDNHSLRLINEGCASAFNIQISPIMLNDAMPLLFPICSDSPGPRLNTVPVDGCTSDKAVDVLKMLLLDPTAAEALFECDLSIEYVNDHSEPWQTKCHMRYERESDDLKMEFLGHHPNNPTRPFDSRDYY